MKLTKTESFVHKNRKQMVFLSVKFRYVAKFCYIAKLPLLAPAFPASSCTNFFTSGLMQSKINHTNSM